MVYVRVWYCQAEIHVDTQPQSIVLPVNKTRQSSCPYRPYILHGSQEERVLGWSGGK